MEHVPESFAVDLSAVAQDRLIAKLRGRPEAEGVYASSRRHKRE